MGAPADQVIHNGNGPHRRFGHRQVRALRRLGIRVAAVFMGQTANLPNAQKIYDRDLAPIRKMDQLSAAAGKLIQQEIMELSG